MIDPESSSGWQENMIKKIYRLKERETKKVLSKWKPFFSYGIVLNSMKNRLSYNRFAIVIWAKSVNTNVTRNFFRRKFYNFLSKKIEENYYKINWKIGEQKDYVFVVKKQTKLDKIDEKSIKTYDKDLNFLTKKK